VSEYQQLTSRHEIQFSSLIVLMFYKTYANILYSPRVFIDMN